MVEYHQCYEHGCHRLVAKGIQYCSIHALLHPLNQHRHDHSYKFKQKLYDAKRASDSRIKFYHSKQWQTLRKEILMRDRGLCQYCLVDGLVTPGNTCDHIVPAQFDPKLVTAKDNLVICCRECHHKKTKWEQEYYGTDQGNRLNEDAAEVDDIALIKKLFELKR